MTPVDYARIHLNVAIKVWQASPRWTSLFPDYPDYCELRVDAESIAYDLAVAQAHPRVPAAAESRRHGDSAAPAPGILSGESGEQSERTADAPSAPDHRTPDRSMQLQGDDDRLVGQNADEICEQWRAGTDTHCSILSVGMPGSMGIGSPGTCPRATSNERREAPQVG